MRIKPEVFWTALSRDVSCAEYGVSNLKNLSFSFVR